jgi:ribosomal protein S18 acetylase RimI-like enzyme
MNESDIKISKLSSDDWKSYKELRLKALKEEPQGFDASFEDFVEKPDEYWIEKTGILVDNEHISLVAKDGEKVVGIICSDFSKNKKVRHIADVSFLYVLPESRGKGVGKKLLMAVLEEVKSNPEIVKVNLRVCSEQKVAVRLYKSVGFEEVSLMKKERFVDGIFYDDYKMSLFI